MDTRIVSAIASLAFLAGAEDSTLHAADLESIRKASNQAIVHVTVQVQLEGNDNRVVPITGSGFLVSTRGHVFTASHVIPRAGALVHVPCLADGGPAQGAPESRIPTLCEKKVKQVRGIFGSLGMASEAGKQPMSLLHRSGQGGANFDAALLVFESGGFDAAQVVKISDLPIDDGHQAVVAGFTDNQFETRVATVSQRLDGPGLVLQVQLMPGFSGGPVFNMYGEVIGIVSSDAGVGSATTGAVLVSSIKDLRGVIGVRATTGTGLTLPGVTSLDQLEVTGKIWGSYVDRTEIQQNWSTVFRDPTCQADYAFEELFCLPPEFKLSAPARVQQTGGDCNSTVGLPMLTPRSNCIAVPTRIRGCAYQTTESGRHCNGSGSVEYTVGLRGRKTVEERELKVHVFRKALVEMGYPYEEAHPMADTDIRVWKYEVELSVKHDGRLVTKLRADSSSSDAASVLPYRLTTKLERGRLTYTVTH